MNDRKILQKIFHFFVESKRDPFAGIGKPEALRVTKVDFGRTVLRTNTAWSMKSRANSLSFTPYAGITRIDQKS